MDAAGSITAVMVTYNSRHVLPASLAPLRQLKHVVVVDNASQDGSADLAAALLPHAVIVRNPANIGFGRATNMGLELARTPYALLLNPDCTLGDYALERLLAAAERYADAAVVAPKLFDGPNAFANNYGPVFPPRRLRGGPEPQGDVCAEWLLGAALLLNMERMRSVGFFDPWFFLFYEEVDLCLRVRRAGYSLVLAGDAQATHVIGRSSPPSLRLAFRRTYCLTLSRLYLTRKYFGALRLCAKWASVFAGSLIVLPLHVLMLNRRRIVRTVARLSAAVAAPRELRSPHCLGGRP